MPFILYSRSTSVTGRKLGELLEVDASRHDPETRVDTLIRWGSSSRVRFKPSDDVINSRVAVGKAAGKLGSLRLMREGHVRVPDFWSADEAGSINPDSFPVLARNINHTQGNDIIPCFQRFDINRALRQGRSFFTRYIPTSREFRVHSFQGEVLKISEKVRTEENEEYVPYIRNYETGYTYRNLRTIDDFLLGRIQEEAHRAVEVLGLDFGAVDVILGDDTNVYVLEVNTGPSLSDNSLEVYAEKFADILGIDFEWPEMEEPEEDELEDILN